MVLRAGADCVQVSARTPVCAGAFSTGELGMALREQALVLQTGHGLVVITGCAHPGIVQMARAAAEADAAGVHMVLGGFHLNRASDAQVQSTITQLKSLGVVKVAPCHCTGGGARDAFRSAWGDNFVDVGVGAILTFPPTTGG